MDYLRSIRAIAAWWGKSIAKQFDVDQKAIWSSLLEPTGD